MEKCGESWVVRLSSKVDIDMTARKFDEDGGAVCWRCGHQVGTSTVCVVCGAVQKSRLCLWTERQVQGRVGAETSCITDSDSDSR